VLIEDGVNGCVVSTLEQLIDTIMNLSINPMKLDKMSRNTRSFVKKFEWSLISKNVINVYESFL